MNKNTLFIGILFIILAFVLGFNIGRVRNTQTITTTDTVYSTIKLTDTVIQSGVTSVKTRVIPGTNTIDTVYLNPVDWTYIAEDTINYKGLYALISDTGNCYGIINRGVKWSGELPSRTIYSTTTRTITQNPKTLSLFAGGIVGLNKGKLDVGPSIGVDLKNKFHIYYSFMVMNGSSNILLTTKIK